jgi:putative GTP pyrophosphokinase
MDMEENTVAVEKNRELEVVALQNPQLTQGIDAFKEVAQQFEELMMMYNSAIREVRTKLEVLNDEFNVRRSHNPISYIKFRVKKPASILEKLKRRGYPVSLASIEENLHDVAGIRVICSYVQDIYMVADMLTSQNDIKLLQVKDYIANPKPNGYRSLHLVVEIPVFFSDGCKPMKVEVQIRTIAMDFWATLEHQLKYKTEGSVPEEISQELKDCSDVIANTDSRMQNIYNSLYSNR